MTRANLLIRIRIIGIVLAAVALLLVVRLYMVQIAHGQHYEERAQSQYVGSVKNLFDRGAIYFTTKDGERVSAATLKVGYTLAVSPDLMGDTERAYQELSALIPLSHDEFMEHALRKGDPYEEVAKRIPQDVAEKIRERNLPGVSLYRDQWRYYPGDALSAHVIGFVAYKDAELAGRYGIERTQEAVLARDSQNLFVNFFAEIFENFGSVVFDAAAGQEGHVVTTLEPTVARALEDEVRKAHEQYGSKETGGIVINPKTGAIYAMSAYPTFNLNDFGSVDEVSVYNNPLVENIYEMGSIIKPLTVAAGLDAGVITRNSTYYDPGFVELDGYTIYNFDKKGRGTVGVQEILNQSLNTGVTHIMKLMGRPKFKEYFKKLELDQKTGIDLPAEVTGRLTNLNNPRDVEYATASFGQGISLSPIATVRALSALGNGGSLPTPHVVDRIIYDDGREEVKEFPPSPRVWSEHTSEEVTRMLVTVVDDALAGGSQKMDRYTIAAKTGTAQIAVKGGKGYYDDRYLHSFFGYFPAYDPEFLIFLYTVEPQNVKYASQSLTTPFMNVAKFLLNYYDVPPDR